MEFVLEVAWASLPITRIHPGGLKNLNYCDYGQLFKTQDQCTIIKYVLEVLRPFKYWTLWMSKWDTVTLHNVLHLYNNMFHHMDSGLPALIIHRTHWKKDLYFAIMFARQKLSKYHVAVTLTMGMFLGLAHIIDRFWKLQSCRQQVKGMDIYPEDKSSYTTQLWKEFLQYMETEYSATHRRLPIIKPKRVPTHNFFSSAIPCSSGQSSHNPYDLSSDEEEHLMI